MSDGGDPRGEAAKSLNERAAERSFRDLMGLLALPALWLGRDGSTVLRLVAEAVEHIVALDLCYVNAPLLRGEPPFTSFRLNGRPVSVDDQLIWQDAIDVWQNISIGAAPVSQGTPSGDLRVLRLRLGYSSLDGSIWFGSTDRNFPSITDLAFLRAAATLGATGLQAARITHEREQASRAKDEFLAMLGHELRNPLAPIVNSLELIKRRGPGLFGRDLAVIERQVSHLRRLVDDLLDVSRITRGNVELKKEALQIKTILLRAIEAVSPLVEQHRHELTIDLPKESAWVFGDPTRLTQVFANLLTNAAKYTDPYGKLWVSSRVENNLVYIHIGDNGAGISDELVLRLFSIFEQGRSTIDRSAGGLGIGLALVKNFVELHGGTVSVTSDGVGRGAEFTVCLPLISPSEVASPALDAPSADTLVAGAAEVRVMLVDDNVDSLESMEMVLRQSGFSVATALGPDEALKVAERFRPAVAVLDIGLPGMNGYELATELRLRFSPETLRLIALSGYGQATDRQKSLAAGFERHFVKPVSVDELIAALVPP